METGLYYFFNDTCTAILCARLAQTRLAVRRDFDKTYPHSNFPNFFLLFYKRDTYEATLR